MKYIYFALIFSFFFVGNTMSADLNGNFSVKGAGRKSCSDFLEAKDSANSDYLLYGGWVEGYISSYNQFQPKNYDITPWQSTELLLIFLAEHCKTNPEARILSVVNGLIKAFFPIRLQEESKLVKVTLGKHDTYYYGEIIKRVKERLKAAQIYHGDTNSDSFGAEEVAAIVKFQENAGLTATGILDQNTLTRLFLKPAN